MTIAEQYEWAKANAVALDEKNSDRLDLTGLPIQIDVTDIDVLPNEQYALLRKNGFGCSDSSALLNVNPYKSLPDLIAEKCRTKLTEEERAVGDKAAVKKGRDLEPFIITKNSEIMQRRIMKPVDMYRYKEFPFLTINYDGVMEAYDKAGKRIYIPNEIKVATYYGGKHYDRSKAYYREYEGFFELPNPVIADSNNTIETKAALYGIPPYYYTQLQGEMMGLDAPFGYLTVLFEKEWQICTWVVWKDRHMQTQLIVNASKAWEPVASKKHLEFDETGHIKGVGIVNGKEEAEKDKARKLSSGLDGSTERLPNDSQEGKSEPRTVTYV